MKINESESSRRYPERAVVDPNVIMDRIVHNTT